MLIVTLVITMVVNGQDFSRHEHMDSLSECWSKAQQTIESIRSTEHKDVEVSQIGVGCVLDIGGDPA